MPYGMCMFLWTDDATGTKFLRTFAALKRMGYDSVEIPIFTPDVRRYERLARDLDRIGLTRVVATALMPDRNLISPDPRIRRNGVAHLKGVAECARALGAPFVEGPIYQGLGVFTGKGPSRDEWKRAVDGLREAADAADDCGVTLSIEYLNRFEVHLVNCAADAVRLARAVNHPRVGVSYDTFHANIEEKSIAAALETVKDRLVHVQISENDRSTPGRGGVNWDETFAALRRIGYRGTLTIEAFGQKLPFLAAATKIWRKMFPSELRLAKDGLAFLKSRWR
jgi:D-psicose/D-tagatose/L-ribulose 3-epimerase